MNPNASEPTDAPAPAPAASDTGNRPPARGGRNRRGPAPQRAQRGGGNPPAGAPHPMLDQLAALYPALFGAEFLPMKRGIFQDLLEAHPHTLDKDGLKAALALHTRSTRYLTAVASGQPRCDLRSEVVAVVEAPALGVGCACEPDLGPGVASGVADLLFPRAVRRDRVRNRPVAVLVAVGAGTCDPAELRIAL